MSRRIILVFISCIFLVGCKNDSKNENVYDSNNSEASIISSSEEISYILTSNLSEKEKNSAEWELTCEQVVIDLLSLEWVTSAEILPDEYEEFCANNQIIIKCETNGMEDNALAIINEYLEILNYFENYEIIID